MTDEEKRTNPLYSEMAYDDAFRTMESECDDVLLPFVNYFFREHYDKTAIIRRMRNEHFVEHEDISVNKRITDSHFEIIQNGITKKYHLECESKTYDGSILVRLFEYDAQIALDESEHGLSTLKVRFPHTGLLLLRGGRKVADAAEIIIETPEGSTKYHVPIIKEADFTVDMIFEKQLYLLIPYYIFNYEKEFGEIERDSDRIKAMAIQFREIAERLDTEVKGGRLSVVSQSAIIRLTHSVIYNLTLKHEAIRKEVGDIMGGKVLDLPEFQIYRKGKEEGIQEGIKEGIQEGKKAGEEERLALQNELEALRKENERLKELAGV